MPTKAKTWNISPCNRITYTSLAQVMGEFIYGVTQHLIVNTGGTAYTVKGSCSGGTGAMDATNRITAGTAWTPRGANSTTSQAWIVLTDANGCDILICYQGASDDVAKVSFSPGGLFVAAGTPNQQPTATDEQVIVSGTTLINATTSADRLWTCWVTSDGKQFRVALARSGVFTGGQWGVEVITPASFAGGVTFSPTVWGWYFTSQTLTNLAAGYAANSTGGLAKFVVASVTKNAQCGGAVEIFGGNITTLADTLCTLQGGGYPVVPIGLYSTTSGSEGKVGNRIDWWVGRASAVSGDFAGSSAFVYINSAVHPWDGSTVVMT